MDAGTDSNEGLDASAEVVEVGAAEAMPNSCGTAVTIYDSSSGAVSTCTFALPPPYDQADGAIRIYFNSSLISAYDPDYWILSADGTEITLTGSYCASIQSGSLSLVQVVLICRLPPLP
jgi:hypothetical protein